MTCLTSEKLIGTTCNPSNTLVPCIEYIPNGECRNWTCQCFWGYKSSPLLNSCSHREPERIKDIFNQSKFIIIFMKTDSNKLHIPSFFVLQMRKIVILLTFSTR